MAEKTKHINDYYDHSRFKDFLFGTKMYLELVKSKEAILSIVGSLVLTVIFISSYYPSKIAEMSNDAKTLLSILISAQIGILGFLIAGLALIVGSIGIKLIEFVDMAGGFDALLSIVFRFYFIGALLALGIILDLFCYLVIGLPFVINWLVGILLTWIVGYLFIFGLIGGTMLMGSCIRLMLLNYKISKTYEELKNTDKR